MSYERMTKKGGFLSIKTMVEEYGYSYIYNRLAELEDKLCDGRLKEFTVKVGDTVYLPCYSDCGEIEYYTVIAVGYDNEGEFFAVDDEDKDIHRIDIIGKEVFLTPNAAEARLKELQEAYRK